MGLLLAAWPAYFWLFGSAIWLAVVDLRSMRIPNKIVLPSIIVVALLLLAPQWGTYATALWASLISFLVFLVLNLVSRGQMGMGDAKLAALLALGLGYFGWAIYLLGLSLGFVFGGLAAVFKLAIQRSAGMRSSFAYGPYLVAGAFVAIVLGFVAA